MTTWNIIRNAFRPGYFPVMAEKLLSRLVAPGRGSNKAPIPDWYRQVADDCNQYLIALNEELWLETRDFSTRLEAVGRERLKNLGVGLGGPANYALLYFLTRLLQPETVVETGVGAGFSSRAILEALRVNNFGRLYSSDFPYFRLTDPERYIGIMVDDHLKDRWKLFMKGDRKNLDEICAKIDRIDLFHYDSDKSYRGRKFALEKVQNLLSHESVVVMDDIEQNLFFAEYISKRHEKYKVVRFAGKYVGLIWL